MVRDRGHAKAGSTLDVYVNVKYTEPMSQAALESDRAARAPGRTWTIAELAKEFGVTARTIRFYEDGGLIAPTRQGINRVYSAGDRARLGWILRGKRLGFSLGEIRELLDLYHADRSGVQQIRGVLRKSREHIAELERKLRDLRAQIAEFREVESHAVQFLREKGIAADAE
jgi:DNA-binding transcriptional MerR regulator